MKLVILDRDGVINEDSDEFIKSPDEFIPIRSSLEAIARLNHAGYQVVIITNQSGIARKYLDIAVLNNIHDKLRISLAAIGGSVEAILYCPHGPVDHCECRKPKTGLFQELMQRFRLESLAGVYAVGDSQRDLEAASAVGALPVLVKTGKGRRTLMNERLPENTLVFDNLSDVVDNLLVDNVR